MESEDHSFDLEMKSMFQNFFQNSRQQYANHGKGHVKHHSQFEAKREQTHQEPPMAYQTQQQWANMKPQLTALNRYQSQINVKRQSHGQSQIGYGDFSRKESSSSMQAYLKSKTPLGSQSQLVNQMKALGSNEDINFHSQFMHKIQENSSKSQSQSSNQCNFRANKARSANARSMVKIDLSNQHLHQLPSQSELEKYLGQGNNRKQKSQSIELLLNNNSITSIVKSYTSLPQDLKILRLSNNQLSYLGGLDLEIAPKLKILDLSCNKLLSLEGLSQAVKLTQLNLSNNQISDSSLGCLSGINRLKVLDLSGNQIKSSLQIQRMLSALLHLRTLNLNSNQMTETFLIDQSLYKLKELFLDSNDLEAFIISRPLQNLRVISIKNNKLQVFKGLDKYCNERLEEVNFEGNELTYISGVKDSYNSIKNLINLKKLNLSHNTIKQFQASQDQLIFPKLDFINLRKNRLKSYHFLSNAQLNLLTYLDLGQNTLNRIENFPSSSIQTLLLDQNQIISLKNINSTPLLKSLNLTANNLQLSNENLNHLLSLQRLEKLAIGIGQAFSEYLIRGLPSLQELDGFYIGVEDNNGADMSFSQRDFSTEPVRTILLPKNLATLPGKATLELKMSQNLNVIKNVDLDDSKEQILNEVIKVSNCKSRRNTTANTSRRNSQHLLTIPQRDNEFKGVVSTQSTSHLRNQQQYLTPVESRTTISDIKCLYRTSASNTSLPTHEMIARADSDQNEYGRSKPGQKEDQPSWNTREESSLKSLKVDHNQVNSHQFDICGQVQNLMHPQALDVRTLEITEKTTQTYKQTLNMLGNYQDTQRTNATESTQQIPNLQETYLLPNNHDQKNYTTQARDLLTMIHLERLQNDVFHLANSLITTYDLSSDQQQKLFEEVNEAILATVSTAILKVKERIKTIYVPSAVIPEEEIESSRLQEKTIELTQYNTNAQAYIESNQSARNADQINVFTLLRTQLSELITELHLRYSQQSIMVTQGSGSTVVSEVSRILKDVCHNGLGIKMTNFELGKYLFNCKEEVQALENEISQRNNPEILLKSKILQEILINECKSVKMDVGVLRQRIMNYVEQLRQEANQENTLPQQITIPDPTLRENKRYNQPQKGESFININEISEIKPQNETSMTPITLIKRCKKLRQNSLNDNKENKTQVTCQKQVEYRSHSQKETRIPSQRHQTLIRLQQNNMECQALNKLQRNPSERKEEQSRNDKMFKAYQQLQAYARHPLQPITQQQSDQIFVNELPVSQRNNNSRSEQGIYEGKLLKYITRVMPNIKIAKAYKAYRFTSIRALEQSGLPKLMFAYIPAENVREIVEHQNYSIVEQQPIYMMGTIDQLIPESKSLYDERIVVFLTSFSSVEDCDITQLHNLETLRRSGRDAIKHKEVVIPLNKSKILAVYVLELVMKL